MSTLAQVQADTLDAEVRRLVISDWFATEWMMVAENDFDFYNELKENAEEANSIVGLSQVLSEDWETLAEQVCDLVEDKISPTASLFIAQLLKGWGSLPFDIIAKQMKETK